MIRAVMRGLFRSLWKLRSRARLMRSRSVAADTRFPVASPSCPCGFDFVEAVGSGDQNSESEGLQLLRRGQAIFVSIDDHEVWTQCNDAPHVWILRSSNTCLLADRFRGRGAKICHSHDGILEVQHAKGLGDGWDQTDNANHGSSIRPPFCWSMQARRCAGR